MILTHTKVLVDPLGNLAVFEGPKGHQLIVPAPEFDSMGQPHKIAVAYVGDVSLKDAE